MKKYGVLIVGTGWVSGEHIRAFSMNPHSEVVAIVSRNADKALAKAKEYGLVGVNCYTDYDQALKDSRVDIVCICISNHLHTVQTIKAASVDRKSVV